MKKFLVIWLIGAILVTIAAIYIYQTRHEDGRMMRWFCISVAVIPLAVFGSYKIEEEELDYKFRNFLFSISFVEAVLIPPLMIGLFYLQGYFFG